MKKSLVKLKIVSFALLSLSLACGQNKTTDASETQTEKKIETTKVEANTLSETELTEGWELLFDGKPLPAGVELVSKLYQKAIGKLKMDASGKLPVAMCLP